MSQRAFASVPFKTPSGRDELTHRHLRIAPRQRTMLLLVDGKRSQEEVIRLAEQAGAPAEHFDELIALGLVALPLEPVVLHDVVAIDPPAPALSAALSSAPIETPPRTGLDVDVSPSGSVAAMLERFRLPTPVDAVGQPALPAPTLDRKGTPPAQPDRVEALFDAAIGPSGKTELAFGATDDHDDPPPVVEEIVVPRTETRFAPHGEDPRETPPHEAAGAPPDGLIRLHLSDALPSGLRHALPETTPMALRRAAAADAPHDEARSLKPIRELLCDTLRFNAPLFSARTLIRVRLAQSRRELIELTWEIEQHLNASRRTRVERGEMEALQAARDLLGMGNTHVAGDTGDSQPGWSSTLGFANTRPQA